VILIHILFSYTIIEKMFIIQNILIPKERFTLDEAIEYVKTNFKYKKVDFPPSAKYYQFIQYQKKYLNNLGYQPYDTITDEQGIKKIIYSS
jgi:hypothetical protein